MVSSLIQVTFLKNIFDLVERDKLLFVAGIAAWLVAVWYGVTRENWFIFGLPFALIVGVMAVENFKNVWYMMIFFLPLSMALQNAFGIPGVNITFPTDLLCIGLFMLALFKMAGEGRSYKALYNHPITWLLGLYLIWQLFPVVTSQIPEVSAKAYISKLWLMGGFFFVSVWMFHKPQHTVYFFWLVGIGFAISMAIIMTKYVILGKDLFGALRFNPMPVFNDHTVFGAFTPMFIPMFLLFMLKGNFSRTFRFFSGVILVILLAGLFFSYSRGAWGSLVISVAIMFAVMMRRWIQRLLIPITAVVLIGGYFGSGFIGGGGASKDAVSRKDFSQHIRSISNFSTDHSNTERINRWKSAIDMAKDRPIFGFGLGTYQFLYGDYQLAKYRTPVSTNHGDNGTAHNEFLLALCEAGFPSMIFMILIFFYPIYRGIRGYLETEEGNIQLIYLGVTFGLITYLFHALVNNFLDQDKIGGAFYAFLAIIVALDLYRKRQQKLAIAESIN